MNKRIAIFVEGLTEQEFTIRLIIELAGKHHITFEIQKQYKGNLQFLELRSSPTPTIYILIVNCCNDEQVKSQIIDQYTSLKTAGYSLIIGLRDVYPLTHSDVPKLEKYLLTGLPVDNPSIHLHLAIMEIEAWFLEEITHFPRIDEGITETAIIANGFDYKNRRAADLPHPTETLHNIYQCVQLAYKKKDHQLKRTINALSYEKLYIETRHKAPSLDKFITSLENGIFSPANL
jgi:hypothetical protein